jgi:hypothetical protein
MKVHLSFDVEVWCNGWQQLDARFPAAFERYVYGRSPAGSYALPATLDILNRHGLQGVFFVEPLFSARFGAQYLQRIVRLIEDAGQQVQLHLHPEWTDELAAPPIADASRKRQHLTHYSLLEQTQLIGHGLALLRAQAQGAVTAFRAGSYAANLDTYRALEANGLQLDSSLNEVAPISGPDLPGGVGSSSVRPVAGVQVYPVSTFVDGLGRLRPAQVGACSLGEMTQALDCAAALGRRHFVIVSHNFEMLRPGSSAPDQVVVRRFEGLCRHLARHPGRFEVGGFASGTAAALDPVQTRPRTAAWATLQRLGEQAWRRLA